MLFEQVKDIVDKEKSRKSRQGYIINLIKEYLQNIVLSQKHFYLHIRPM